MVGPRTLHNQGFVVTTVLSFVHNAEHGNARSTRYRRATTGWRPTGYRATNAAGPGGRRHRRVYGGDPG